MTKLSVNINKVATLRNTRGGNVPDLVRVALDVERFGADGITVHPRPDERHIRYQDVRDLSKVLTKEFNIEGNPTEEFLRLVEEIKPAQVTLVPDAPEALTSNAGWDVAPDRMFLTEVIERLHHLRVRVSIFVDTRLGNITDAKEVGADRIELYTEPYALAWSRGVDSSAVAYAQAAKHAKSIGLGVNAGHDLSLDNLGHFSACIPEIDEVSIGHALISEALYLGLEETIRRYQSLLGKEI